MDAITKTKIQAILQDIKKSRYENPLIVSDSQAMGILMASFFEWDGLEILKATHSGLEDSNFHSENRTINSMIKNLE